MPLMFHKLKFLYVMRTNKCTVPFCVSILQKHKCKIRGFKLFRVCIWHGWKSQVSFSLTLSKQTQLMEPETLIILEFMQYTLAFFNRWSAYNFPTVIAAGRAGGITMVIKSKALMRMSIGSISLVLCKNRGNVTFSRPRVIKNTMPVNS